MGLIMRSTSPILAPASSLALRYLAKRALTTFAVFSSLVLADSMVPISMLNGPPVSASCSSLSAVMRGGLTAFIVLIIPSRIFFTRTVRL